MGELAWSATAGLLYSDWSTYQLWRLSPEGTRALVADSYLPSAQGIATDAAGAEVAWGSSIGAGYHNPMYVKQISKGRARAVADSRRFVSQDPTLSPDGRRVAYDREICRPMSLCGGDAGIWVSPVGGGRPSRIATHGDLPEWSPDGRWIDYEGGHGNLVLVAPNGKRRTTLRYARPADKLGIESAWSPNSEKIAVWLRALSIFDPATGLRHTLSFPTPKRLAGFSWAPDSTTLLVATDGSCPTLWSVSAAGLARHVILRSC